MNYELRITNYELGRVMMKLSELQPCAVCGGPIGVVFYRVAVEQMMIDAKAANQVMGLNLMFGGAALRLAEALAPVDDVTVELQRNVTILCDDCAYTVSLVRVLLGVERARVRMDGGEEAT